MRPIKLTMTAFGPFIETETIDFEALGERPLFLINGPTGSGKTTILDAICFALYGQTTGKEREAGQMRCDYSDDKTLTTVEFVFELGNTQYRIKRTPEQQRAKAKGEGTTRQAADAQLYKLEENGDVETLLVARKVSEATKEIEQLTGLQVDQFRQVMVLPQGQFRRLLMADSKDREQIFSQLFETQIYKRIEDKLKAQAKKVYIDVAKLRENQQGVLQSVGMESLNELTQSITALKPICDAATIEAEDKQKAHLLSVKGYQVGSQLVDDFNSLNKQRDRIKQFEQQADDIVSKKRQLSHALLAQKIEPRYNDLMRLTQTLSSLNNQIEQVSQHLKSNKQSLAEADSELENNKERNDRLDKTKQSLITLINYRERAIVLQQAHNVYVNSQKSFKAGEAALLNAQQQLDNKSNHLEACDKEITTLETALKNASDIRLAQQKVTEQLNNRQDLESLIVKMNTFKMKLNTVVEQEKVLKNSLDTKQQHAKQLEMHWHTGQASLLASELEQDAACPVCGSKDHPAPAQADLQLPSDSERDVAQSSVDKAQQLYLQARENYTSVDTELKSLLEHIKLQEKRLGENATMPLESIKQHQQSLTEQLAANRDKQQQLDTLKLDYPRIKQNRDAANKDLECIKSSQSILNATLQSDKALVESSEKELPQPYRVAGKLEKTISDTEESIKQLENEIDRVLKNHGKLSNQYTELKTTQAHLQTTLNSEQNSMDNAAVEWNKALTDSPFNTDDDYKSAQLDEVTIDNITTTIEHYETHYQQAKGALQQQTKLLNDKIKPDLNELNQTVEKALQEKLDADKTLKQLDIQLSGLTKATDTLQSYAEKLAEKEQMYKVVGTLSDVANGVTGNKISLQRFVLGVLLDDVLIEASHRLIIMSKGRYLLLRKEDRAKGNKASGLELEVEDNYTGKIRAVSTLSGGESFMASLSLALGLSDVVQAYAGGMRLDTLFIDEGFGSLDADSLDLAIRTLIDLRNTGRMVGIISHVSELKEQISLRLDIKSGRYGSHVEMVS